MFFGMPMALFPAFATRVRRRRGARACSTRRRPVGALGASAHERLGRTSAPPRRGHQLRRGRLGHGGAGGRACRPGWRLVLAGLAVAGAADMLSRHLPPDGLEPDHPRPSARPPGRHRAGQLLDRAAARQRRVGGRRHRSWACADRSSPAGRCAWPGWWYARWRCRRSGATTPSRRRLRLVVGEPVLHQRLLLGHVHRTGGLRRLLGRRPEGGHGDAVAGGGVLAWIRVGRARLPLAARLRGRCRRVRLAAARLAIGAGIALGGGSLAHHLSLCPRRGAPKPQPGSAAARRRPRERPAPEPGPQRGSARQQRRVVASLVGRQRIHPHAALAERAQPERATAAGLDQIEGGQRQRRQQRVAVAAS